MKVELPEGMTKENVENALKSLAKKAPKAEEREPKVFKTIELNDGELRVSQDFYKGREFLSIRKWYTDRDSGELKPGKGVTFTFEEIDSIIEGLTLMKSYLEENP